MADMNLFEAIGSEMITCIITEFYQQAFDDPIIGHFFFGKNQSELTEQQIQFASVLLGSKSHRYKGRPLKSIHKPLPIGMTHFRRRQVILAEAMVQCHLDDQLAEKWLALEYHLRGQILGTETPDCEKTRL